ncbi:MAG: hydroxymethylglutaryl-CoA reductase (NADPH) [Chlamydiales bacterium]|jgi:hydroxymethylglutaryl-CoA reductase (NADPH)
MPDPQPDLARIPRDPDDDFQASAIERRREFLSRATEAPLAHLFGAPVPPEEARGNIENLVGFAQVPVGLAGPLRVETSQGWRDVLVPMATSEGALVASYSRGMRLIGEAGGAWSRVVSEQLSQHPVLVFASAREALAAGELCRGWFEKFAALVGQTTRHGSLVGVEPQVLGRRLILRLLFRTGDAIGINMASRAADQISELVARDTGALERFVHGQDVEKRANARALVEGRGRSVVCDVTIPRAVLERVTRTTPEALESISRTYARGFAQMGTQNWAVQSANGLAAVMLACGQDVAYLTESATGFLDLECTLAGDLHAAITLPSLLVGTVGGGALKGTARECLGILDCVGAGKGNLFAEILGAVVLAGDLSLMAAFCTHEFVAAHERLGRNRPVPDAEAGP